MEMRDVRRGRPKFELSSERPPRGGARRGGRNGPSAAEEAEAAPGGRGSGAMPELSNVFPVEPLPVASELWAHPKRNQYSARRSRELPEGRRSDFC